LCAHRICEDLCAHIAIPIDRARCSETGFIPFHASLGGLWGEINVGISGQVTLTTSLYANASYQSRFDGGGFAYDGKVGLRVNW
jgi:outer membrane autotransporter protein